MIEDYNINRFKIKIEDCRTNKYPMQKVVEKVIETSYEAGSGMLYIPILADIFPKLFNQKMREFEKYKIYTEKYNYEVKKEDYLSLKVGDTFDENLSIYS